MLALLSGPSQELLSIVPDHAAALELRTRDVMQRLGAAEEAGGTRSGCARVRAGPINILSVCKSVQQF